MMIEVDEKTIENMQEDIDGYISLIKRYEAAYKVKTEIIDGYEKELRASKNVILLLIQMLRSKKLTKKQTQVIDEIEVSIKELEY